MTLPLITEEVYLAVNTTLQREGAKYLEDGLTKYMKNQPVLSDN